MLAVIFCFMRKEQFNFTERKLWIDYAENSK